MNKRFLAVLAFAFVVATVASVLLYRMMSRPTATTAAAAPTFKLLVASRNLEVGTLIKDTDIQQTAWGGTIPSSAVNKKEDLITRGVIVPIFANEPFVESRLAIKGAGGGLASMIRKGMRAVAIRVNEVIGVAGFVVPGMRVDVLISGCPPGTAVGIITKTLLQNVEVLSAGQEFKKDTEGKPVTVQVINLLVSPEDAEKLSLASGQTTIQLVLRNPLDQDTVKTTGIALPNLFSGATLRRAVPVQREDGEEPHAAPRPRAAPKPRNDDIARATINVLSSALAGQKGAKPDTKTTYVMEIIQGTKRSEAKFDDHPTEAKP